MSSPPAGDSRLALAWQLVQSPAVTTLSLDIFDTLLWRVVPEPAQAFVLLGRRLADRGLLAPGVTPTAFARLRRQAEVRARERAHETRGGWECRLPEIWEELRPVVTADVSAGVGEEVALEYDVCRPDLAVVELAERAHKLGRSVLLVSDTYFSSDQLRRLLDRPELEGVLAGPLEVAASCEYGVGKAAGLFEAVCLARGLRPEQVVHVGDSSVADVEGAEAAGITAVHYRKGSESFSATTDAEGVTGVPLGDPRAVDDVLGDCGLTALRARASMLAEEEELAEPLRFFFSAGATVLGPSFAGFAAWVHERAAAHGASTVLCLMREGEFLDGLIRAAAPAAAVPVASEPMWLSRQVLALARVTSGSREELRSFLVRRRPTTVAGLFAQLGADARLAPELTDVLGAPLDAPEVVERVLDALDAVPQLRAEVVRRGRLLRAQLYAALDAQLPPDGPVVVVDVGWGGTIQALLSQLLADRGTPRDVVGLYLVTQAVAEARRLDGLVPEGYLASGGEPEELMAPLLRTPEILEQVCMADAGTLVGFAPDGAPACAPERMPRWQVAQKDAAQAGVHAFLRLWLTARSGAPERLDLSGPHARRLLLRQLSRLVTRPSAAEALAFGGWLHDDNFGAADAGAILDPLTLARVRAMSPEGLARLAMRDAFWPVGAARLVDPTLAAVAGLVAEGAVDPVTASTPAEVGDMEVYVDEGQDFVAGPKEIVPTTAGPQGRVHVRARQPVRRAERVRVDWSPRAALLRVDWLRVIVHTARAAEPILLEITDLARDGLHLNDAVLLPSGVVQLVGEDPFLAVDLRVLAPAAAGSAYLVDVELAFAALLLPAQDRAVSPPAAASAPPPPPRPLWKRAARRLVREARARL